MRCIALFARITLETRPAITQARLQSACACAVCRQVCLGFVGTAVAQLNLQCLFCIASLACVFADSPELDGSDDCTLCAEMVCCLLLTLTTTHAHTSRQPSRRRVQMLVTSACLCSLCTQHYFDRDLNMLNQSLWSELSEHARTGCAALSARAACMHTNWVVLCARGKAPAGQW